MYSTPHWALNFAAHCRSRLRTGAVAATPGIRRDKEHALLVAHRGFAAWHAACWANRRALGNS